jgi:hypothetical protein
MGRGPNVTKEEYDFIKLLIMKSQSTEEICKRVKRSPDTVRCVGYSTDYDDFRTTPTKELRKRRKKDENYQITVDDVCPQEDVASQCDENPGDPPKLDLDETLNIRASEYILSAKDKKELAMYAIDQHYFFLKQLTGVI